MEQPGSSFGSYPKGRLFKSSLCTQSPHNLLLGLWGMTRKCNLCGESKSAEFFCKKSRTKDGLSLRCRDCSSLVLKQHFQKNKDLYNKRNSRSRAKFREFVLGFKNKPCTDCKKVFRRCVMDFDHRPGEEKLYEISKMYTLLSKTKFLNEIAKCDLVCANCHRIRSCDRDHLGRHALIIFTG